jgi:hypothetical protein
MHDDLLPDAADPFRVVTGDSLELLEKLPRDRV